jgi:hypothetical protein
MSTTIDGDTWKLSLSHLACLYSALHSHTHDTSHVKRVLAITVPCVCNTQGSCKPPPLLHQDKTRSSQASPQLLNAALLLLLLRKRIKAVRSEV